MTVRTTAPRATSSAPATSATAPRTNAVAPRAAAASTAVTAPPAGLGKGDSGTKVRQLQQGLVKLGYLTQAQMNTGVGSFGPATEAAVKKFQGDHKIATTGYYGEQTAAALKKALTKTTPPPTEPGKFTKPTVISAPSPNSDSRNGADIDAIVLHHTGTNNGAGDMAWMRNPDSKVSAHYMLDRDGKIYQLVGDTKRAWHAGKGELHGVPTDVNARSIGIEIVNDGSGKTAFTDAQYKALTQLVGYLKQEYKVPANNIVGHKDVAVPKGRKDDPAANFDWARLRKGIGG
ncbi:peptidoglycan recognition protein family protein [Corallococcus carmarthensis]|uniref:peptidoglycan recognition protein family protein n=1 Tax=Corallococcus carmarthensis TaxID=2316728 RepID=UPI00148DE10E|nr:N-acetylmuramoyl-L-alanine amidase [Corallococcus carmarthensis]NOK19953.1 N-acetylmuramoyl-L-alanine amidase [Corallococcus carmarthensis]